MTDHQAFQQVRQALECYYRAIENPQSENLEQAVMALELISQSPDPSLPPMLRHYLESRSYRKARDFVASL